MTMARKQWRLLTLTKWILGLAVVVGGGLALESTSWSRWVKITGDFVLLAIGASIVGGLVTRQEHSAHLERTERTKEVSGPRDEEGR